MTPRTAAPVVPAGGFVLLDGRLHARIAGADRMPPFFMTVASDADLWMFITSEGGLTAGRVDADGSLFPYETVDRLHDAPAHTGPVTLIRVARADGAETLWEPFLHRRPAGFRIERNLYKSATGTRVIFEELNRDLDLVFRYRWAGSDDLGWVRTATLVNRGAAPVSVRLLDGLRNVLPWGAPLALYRQASSLVDAYRRTDLDPGTGLAIFSLTSRITDRAEAAESLRANGVWCHGFRDFEVLLSPDAIDAFRAGTSAPVATVLSGRRGNYLVRSVLDLDPGATAVWHLVADVGLGHARLAAVDARLRAGGNLHLEIEESLRAADENLVRIVASADGLQRTERAESDVHHFANTLFNVMRGGVFAHGHDVPAADLSDFVRTRNRAVAQRHRALLDALPAELPADDLAAAARRSEDPDFERLCLEYLPLWFGRRHGDPSRPWNRFTIRVKNPDGTRALRYEGNWRDIFQNWEALAASFPGFLPGMIAKFLNASTVDGFNPYRITRDGIEWETVDPHDPWSYIGYWGDHQIVYLLRLLEALERHAPGTLEGLLERGVFSYADVPYRIRSYAAMLENPRATVDYDVERAACVEARVRETGTDGRLVVDADGSIRRASLLEKLLVPALAKLSNFVPDGGIWMNTQRPEWNDANNALVGNGVSVVTLCHLRRYLDFLARLVEGAPAAPVSAEIVAWFRDLLAALEAHRPAGTAMGDRDRRTLLDALGDAYSRYRDAVYGAGLSGREPLDAAEVVRFCRAALVHVDHAVRANRREDGLYHAYNLLEITRDPAGARLGRLPEMLEGQVAALASGLVDPEEAVALVDALFRSPLYCREQRSFLLYPDRPLPPFMERNAVPEDGVRAVPLLAHLLEAGETSILERDAAGVVRFHADFADARGLAAALDRLAARDGWREAVAADRDAVLALFERVFQHHRYTGRSGTMVGYEGLGCVYWHMVAKLLLSVQEVALIAAGEEWPVATRDALARAYYRIRSGLGYEKPAAEYGAFPTDPYSHTPPHAGAQQPGMTGQVKEEILTRFGELGALVEDGIVSFRPRLLRRAEFLAAPGRFTYYDLEGAERSIEIAPGSLAFTFCGTPVVYRAVSGDARIRVTRRDGRAEVVPGDRLDRPTSRVLLARTGEILRLDVDIPERSLLEL